MAFLTEDEMDKAMRAEYMLRDNDVIHEEYRREFGHLVWCSDGDFYYFYRELMKHHFDKVHKYLLQRYYEILADDSW